MRRPMVDLSDCILCGVCEEISPTVFHLNDAGYIEVRECVEYSEDEVAEAMKNCPADCIEWEDDS